MTNPPASNALGSLLETALAPVATELAELNSRIMGYLPVHSKSAKQISEHIFTAGGKRIRPALFLMTAKLFKQDNAHTYSMAAVCEFVHTASLLHDDVVDNSTLRRNRPTANSIWGDESAVLVGDLIYARASELMADTGKLAIVKNFAEAIRLMSEGELLQLENVFDANLTEDRYLDVVFKKTAVLIASACKAAGILADASEEQVTALGTYGTAVGMTFQIVDDCLDYMTSTEHLGKPMFADLAQGKVTLPLIHLLRAVSPEERQYLSELCQRTKQSPEEIQKVRDLMSTHKALESSLELAHAFSEKALDALKQFPDSVAKTNLQAIVGFLALRDF